MNILFLISGGGGNLKFFSFLKHKGLLKRDIQLYAISYKECDGINVARKKHLPYFLINYSRNYNIELIERIKFISPNIIFTTWNKIIDEETLIHFQEKFYNLHYSLLPAFKGYMGMQPIQLAYDLNCQYIGSTIHQVTKEVDGGKIVGQYVMRKSGDIQNDINMIFRNSCILLLNITSILSNDTILNIPLETNDVFQFQPALRFNTKYFNDSFWNEFKDF